MRQPDNLPAFCRVHRNGRLLMQKRARSPGGWRFAEMTRVGLVSACSLVGAGQGRGRVITAQVR
jgi:hypothetical protein